MDEAKNREELVLWIKKVRAHHYRYVTRDENSKYIVCYSIEPKKYSNRWGYTNENALGAKMAKAIYCTCCSEIDWSNKKPILIDEWLKVYG